ncbi:pilus assembly protein [Rhodobacteraceae bacterium HSP-20]|uniref:Pilus assembly protein n=1 Tax=Paragemmobacter amnigenus TaxID=2852097 RepID=A0ABS6J188_9RHOB|nr:TadE/TadG family type IV pilus assembly protein [Rhodobacter amnigenus]MBU9697526.1 pilus assembly protein [Rhodobacter amnigenus]MBV4388753.1 pilus assembly protein [Rhodobacter amnigenus]
MRRLRQFLTETSGAAAIEFAILSPLFLILLVGMLNLGSQAFTQARLNQTVRETAEAALFTQDTAVLSAILRAALTDAGLPTSGSTGAVLVELRCLCGIEDLAEALCTVQKTASCTATGMPWELVFKISTKIPFTPPLPIEGYGPRELTSELRVQLR